MMKSILFFCRWFLVIAAGALPLSAQDQTEHILGPNDIIDVRVFQEPDLDALKVTIASDGMVSLSLIGEIKLGGLGCSAAAKAIIAQYKQGYLVNPNVTVSIAAKAKKRYTVLGAVNKPGSYNFPDGENMSILQAIGSAGGYNRLASPKRVTIKRAKVKEPIKLDLRKLTESGEAGTIMIQPGDVITIGESVL